MPQAAQPSGSDSPTTSGIFLDFAKHIYCCQCITDVAHLSARVHRPPSHRLLSVWPFAWNKTTSNGEPFCQWHNSSHSGNGPGTQKGISILLPLYRIHRSWLLAMRFQQTIGCEIIHFAILFDCSLPVTNIRFVPYFPPPAFHFFVSPFLHTMLRPLINQFSPLIIILWRIRPASEYIFIGSAGPPIMLIRLGCRSIRLPA